jgi:hypothetical protein
MKLCDQLTDYINAAFTGLWIQSFEPDEAEREIIQHARQKRWKLPCGMWPMSFAYQVPKMQKPLQVQATHSPL